jgi:hypothetical protein
MTEESQVHSDFLEYCILIIALVYISSIPCRVSVTNKLCIDITPSTRKRKPELRL